MVTGDSIFVVEIFALHHGNSVNFYAGSGSERRSIFFFLSLAARCSYIRRRKRADINPAGVKKNQPKKKTEKSGGRGVWNLIRHSVAFRP